MRVHLLLLPLVLAACAAAPTAATPIGHGTQPPKASQAMVTHAPDAQLLGSRHWRLAQATDAQGARIDALFVRADKPLQLDFSAGSVHVSNSCNGIGGSYQVTGGKLVVGALRHTMMACAGAALNQLDGQISARLAGSPAITVVVRGIVPQLTLKTTSGDTLVFSGVPAPAPQP